MISALPDVNVLTNEEHKFMVVDSDGLRYRLHKQEIESIRKQTADSGLVSLKSCLTPDTSGDGTG